MAEFWGDLKKAVRAWRVAPLLPLFTLALQIPFYLPQIHPAWSFAAFIASIFYVGYVGTERLWYLAVWRGEPFSARRVWGTSWSYFRRFFAFGVVWLALGLLLWGVLVGIGVLFGMEPKTAMQLALIPATFVGEIWFTFVTPSFAYSTDVVKDAMTIGWRLLKGNWRHTAIYALAPPVTGLALLQRAEPEAVPNLARLVLGLAGVLVYLALKGATAAYYVRHHGVVIPEGEVHVPYPNGDRTALQTIRDRVQPEES